MSCDGHDSRQQWGRGVGRVILYKEYKGMYRMRTANDEKKATMLVDKARRDQGQVCGGIPNTDTSGGVPCSWMTLGWGVPGRQEGYSNLELRLLGKHLEEISGTWLVVRWTVWERQLSDKADWLSICGETFSWDREEGLHRLELGKQCSSKGYNYYYLNIRLLHKRYFCRHWGVIIFLFLSSSVLTA